ncbi:MAG TPA: Gx transporter family protein [Negativicutes bacterium]|jgi:heptaprenyl diphosphate synthase
MVNTKKIVLLALFVAMASVLHVVESWIPLPLPVPGIKLGLANIVSLVVIYLYGWREAIYIAILRVLLGSLFGGTLLGPAFFMSISGAIVSTIAMALVQYYWQPPFSIIGVSVIGSVVHNFAQIMIAALLVTSSSLLWYLPYLIVFAVITGVITGLTTSYFLAKAPRFC